MIPLHKYPAGYLEALDLKTLGRPPNELEERVRTVYDASQHYRQSLLKQTQSAVVISAGNTAGTALTVPQNEFWRVRHVSGTIAVGVNSQLVAHIAVTYPQVPGTTPVSPKHYLSCLTAPLAMAAATLYSMHWQPTQDFFVPGLTLFNLDLGAVLAADATVTLRMLYEDLSPVS